MSGQSARGKFIVFDGPDGGGKSTAVARTVEWLKERKIPVWQTKQPGGSKYGDEIRKIMFETVGTTNVDPDALRLLFLSNHLHNCADVAPRLAAGTWVVADRWATSAIPYMIGGVDRPIDPRVVSLYRHFVKKLPWDVWFYLTGYPETLLERARARTTETHQGAKAWNDVAKARRITRVFDELAKVRSYRAVKINTCALQPGGVMGRVEKVLEKLKENA